MGDNCNKTRSLSKTCRTSTGSSVHSPWTSFYRLRQDPEGIELFEKYLDERNLACYLKFWFACEGIKMDVHQKNRNKLVRIIHKKFIRSGRIAISDSTRENIRKILESKQDFCPDIFAAAQSEVEKHLEYFAFPGFLQSSVYFSYLNRHQVAVSQFSDRNIAPEPSPSVIRESTSSSLRGSHRAKRVGHQKDPEAFAALLIEKLNALKNQQQSRNTEEKFKDALIEERFMKDLMDALKDLQLESTARFREKITLEQHEYSKVRQIKI